MAILDFTDVKNVTERKGTERNGMEQNGMEQRGPGSVFSVDLRLESMGVFGPNQIFVFALLCFSPKKLKNGSKCTFYKEN